MARLRHPAPFPMREPEPSDRALRDPELVRLYAEAKNRYLAGEHAAALELYERLADRVPFDGPVSHFVGSLHLWGVGARRDTDQAEQWFQRAVVGGDNYAFLSLYKLCHETGRPEKARQWLEQAANAGYAPAMFFLGHGWEFGHWGAVDQTRALKWYERAAEHGYYRADWRIGAIFLKGACGLWRIPLGALKYMWAPLKMARVLWRDPYDERVIW